MVVDFTPNVVGGGIDIASVIPEAATKECETVGKLPTSSGSRDEQLLDVVVARELRQRLALATRISLKSLGQN